MTSLLSSHRAADPESTQASFSEHSAVARRPLLMIRVGRVLRRRFMFCIRFIYWSIRHRSTANAAWIANFEGYSWN